MVYKRYIKKGEKVYGPYSYHSKKENGKVVSKYIGKDSGKKIINRKKFKKFLISAVLILLLLLVGFLIFSLNSGLTGNVTLPAEKNYERSGFQKVSRKLFSRDHQSGKEMWRVTLLFEELPFKVGQIIDDQGDEVKIINISKRKITVRDLETGKKHFLNL